MKIRLEISDDAGMKTTIEFEGDLCRERVIGIIESLDFSEKQYVSDSSSFGSGETLTIKERLKSFLRYDYPRVWFTSWDVKKRYEQEAYGEKINLSTVSTYLARMYREDILDRRGSKAQREYKLIEDGELDKNDAKSTSKSLY